MVGKGCWMVWEGNTELGLKDRDLLVLLKSFAL